MQPRPYQVEAGEALDHYLRTQKGNPVIEVPTAGGKTVIMACAIKRYLESWPDTRVLVLAHVRELLTQGAEKMKAVWPEAPIGIYCAALGQKEMDAPITYASIQSVHRKAFDFRPWDLIFVDEAHRIPLKGETTYRNFINDAKINSPHLRVVGWTATPYRLGGGAICGPNYILNDVAYRIGVKTLIEQGYLCKLRSKVAEHEMDTSGIQILRGEFVESQLNAKFNRCDIVDAAVRESMQRLQGRKSILYFCCSVSHAESVRGYLHRYGVDAPVVHAGTSKWDRDKYVQGFVKQHYRTLCNVNVLTEGFDAPCVDAIVMLRPTQSAALYYQTVGRGLRLFPSKADCLVLDFAGNVRRHGPIDEIVVGEKGSGAAPTKTCPNCMEIIGAGRRECPDCGYIFEDLAEPDRSPKHEPRPDQVDVVSNSEPWDVEVKDVRVTRKVSKGKGVEMLVVTYYGLLEHHSEFICLNHEGHAQREARRWWRVRFGDPVPNSVAEALPQLFSAQLLEDKLKTHTKRITCRREGKFVRVTPHFESTEEGSNNGNAAAA